MDNATASMTRRASYAANDRKSRLPRRKHAAKGHFEQHRDFTRTSVAGG